MFSSYTHKELRLLSFKNGGGEKMGGEEREGGEGGEVSGEERILRKLEEVLQGVEGEEREVLEEVIAEAFSGDEEALESVEEELGKLGEEVKEWVGADLSLEKVVVVGRLLGVDVSGEALSFVEGEVKEGDVETVDGGREEVEKVIEAVGVLKGVEVKIVGGEVVVECEGVEKRVGWEGKSGIFLKNALRASMRGVRLEASMNGLEGKEGLEGVTFSLKGQSAVVVKYGEVEREVDVGKMGDRWVLQKMKLLVVGKEVRGEGREKMKEAVHTTKGGVELSIDGLSAADLQVLILAEKPEEEGGMGLKLISSAAIAPSLDFDLLSIAFAKQGEKGAFVNAVDTRIKKGESFEEHQKRFTKEVVAMLRDVKKNMENKAYNPLVTTLNETVGKLMLKEGTTVKLGKTLNGKVLNVPVRQDVVIQVKGKEAVTYEVIHRRDSDDGVIKDEYSLYQSGESTALPKTKEELLTSLQAEVKKLEGGEMKEEKEEKPSHRQLQQQLDAVTDKTDAKNIELYSTEGYDSEKMQVFTPALEKVLTRLSEDQKKALKGNIGTIRILQESDSRHFSYDTIYLKESDTEQDIQEHVVERVDYAVQYRKIDGVLKAEGEKLGVKSLQLTGNGNHDLKAAEASIPKIQEALKDFKDQKQILLEVEIWVSHEGGIAGLSSSDSIHIKPSQSVEEMKKTIEGALKRVEVIRQLQQQLDAVTDKTDAKNIELYSTEGYDSEKMQVFTPALEKVLTRLSEDQKKALKGNIGTIRILQESDSRHFSYDTIYLKESDTEQDIQEHVVERVDYAVQYRKIDGVLKAEGEKLGVKSLQLTGNGNHDLKAAEASIPKIQEALKDFKDQKQILLEVEIWVSHEGGIAGLSSSDSIHIKPSQSVEEMKKTIEGALKQLEA